MVVGLPRDVQGPQSERQCLLPLLFWCRGHGSNESGTVHEEDLHEDQGHCYTRGRVTPTRKHTAREISLHRISRAVHDAHEMSMKAANNSLHNYLAYQWFALSGSKRGSTPVPGKCYDDTWLKFLNAVLTQSSVSTAGHCRFLGGWHGSTKQCLLHWPWSLSSPEITALWGTFATPAT